MKAGRLLSVIVAIMMMLAVMPVSVEAGGGPQVVHVNYTWADQGDVPAGKTWGVDAFATIQAGLNAVDVNGTVHVADGVYEEDLLFPRSLMLQGESEDGVVIKISGNGAYALRNTAGMNHLILKNFTVDATDYELQYIFKLSGAETVTMENITVNGPGKDFRPNDTPIGGVDLHTIQLATLNNVTVRNVSRNAFSFSVVDTVSLGSITAEDCGSSAGWAAVALYGTDADKMSLEINGEVSFENTPIGFNMTRTDGNTDTIASITLGDEGSVVMEGVDVPLIGENFAHIYAFAKEIGTFYQVPFEGTALYYYALEDAPHFTVIYDLGKEIFKVVEGLSIQRTLNYAYEGATIYVYPGDYNEGSPPARDVEVMGAIVAPEPVYILYFNKAVSIHGVDVSGEVVECWEDIEANVFRSNPPDSFRDFSYAVYADNVTITGLHFWTNAANIPTEVNGAVEIKGLDDSPQDVIKVGSGFAVEGDNFVMANCKVSGPDEDGTNLYAVAFDGVDVDIESGLLHGNYLIGGVVVGMGAGSDEIAILNNTIVHQYPGWLAAIYVYEAEGPVVAFNNIVLDNLFPHDGHLYPVLALAEEAEDLPSGDWLLSLLVMQGNTFTSAYGIMADVEEGLIEPIFFGEGTYALVVYSAFALAADRAGPEDTVVAFHYTGYATFYPEILREGNTVGILGKDSQGYPGAAAFIPVTALPEPHAEYTVSILPADAPADAPAGFEFRGQVFTFTLEADGEEVREFEGPVTLWFFFNPEDIDDFDDLVVSWYDADAEEWVMLETTVDETEGRASVTVERWSDFVLMEGEEPVIEPDPDPDPEPETPETGTGIMWLIPFGLLLLAGGLMIRRRVTA